jgi:ribosome-associated protein
MTLFGKKKTKKSTTRPKVAQRPSRKLDGKMPAKATPSQESCRIALLAASAGLDKKAKAVDILDVTGKVDYADFIVLMTGQNDRHVSAIAHAVDQALHEGGVQSVAVEGLPASTPATLSAKTATKTVSTKAPLATKPSGRKAVTVSRSTKSTSK